MILPRSTSHEWHHDDVFTGEVRLHVVRDGQGRPVVLLHGFPDFWFSWRYQIRALADAGFAVVAPDLRGYNWSDKPRGVAAYNINRLVADVVALVESTCGGRAHLVGHDWGGIVAWYAAMRRPEHFDSLVIVNAPHPDAFARDFWTTRQWLRSWYMFLFQLPKLPEMLARHGNWRAIEETFSREVFGRDAFAHGEIDDYKAALAVPGALQSAIHYYRAAARRFVKHGTAGHRPINIPTLLLWGDRDNHLGTSLTTGLEPWVRNLTVRRFADAGHWLHLDEPELVSNSLIEWFTTHSA